MDNLKMRTPDLAAENYKKLAALFPNAVTETVNERGEVVRAIDADVLRQEISATVVEGPQERYQFTWPDKKKSVALANAPIAKTVRLDRAKSVGRDGTPGGIDTENIYIEGDNLDALKLLQETYLGKVKMIYIDPPYNTGNDFIYEDDFAQGAEEYLAGSGQFDEEGNRLVQNTESNGRFHTDWLNMLYPRLRLAKDLLADDGVIFISIDDNEVENLKKICDEVFGRDNFLSNFCWKTDGNFDNQAKIKKCHEYILMYAKNEMLFKAPPVVDPSVPKTSKIYRKEIKNTIVKNGPKNPISAVVIPIGFPCSFKNGKIENDKVIWPKYNKDLIVSDYKTCFEVEATSGWSAKVQFLEFINNDFKPILDIKGQETVFVITESGAIEAVKKRAKHKSHVISILQGFGSPQIATRNLSELGKFFNYPKPVDLLKYLSSMVSEDNSIFLDFFSGSATTAHAVMKLNAEDGGHRKFIMVQLPEPCDEKSEACKAGYRTICDIGEERIRRAGKKIKSEASEAATDLDIGFRVFRVDSTNMKDVYYTPADYVQGQLEGFADNIKEDRTPEDLLFQVMLDLGILLSSPIEEEEIAEKHVFSVADGYLIACFDEKVTEETVTAIAKRQPHYAVFRDSSMANDSVAANFEQIFKTYSPKTQRKVL